MKRIVAAVLAALLLVSLAGCGQTPTKSYSADTNVMDLGSPYKYHFEQLTVVEKQAYNAVLSVILDFPEEVTVPTLTKEELKNFYTALLHDNPSLFFLGNSPTVRQNQKHSAFVPQYIMGKADYEAMLRKCNSVSEKIRTEAQKAGTDYDKELYVHDALVNMCSYNDDSTNPYRSSIYGALCGGNVGCEGYAKTAKYILDQLNIPCYVVTGQSTPPGAQTQDHMWNIVQIGGEYYHLDLTWDDPVLEKGGDLISHTYFNVNDESIRKTHSGFESKHPCFETMDNYFVHEELEFGDFGRAEHEKAVALAVEALGKGSDGFQLKFISQSAYEKAQRVLVDESGIYRLLKDINEQLEEKIATDRLYYFCTDDENLFEIIVER